MKNFNRRRVLMLGGLGGLFALAAGPWGRAGAQALPDTARIIVGFPPGGAPDVVARQLAERLRGRLAAAVVVENRPGASGRIAVDAARQQAPDGQTLMLNPAGVLTVNPHTFRSLNYKPFEDLTPVGLACVNDFGFGVGPAVPASVKTLAEFAAWAKSPANAGKVTYGSPAAGAPPHFVGDVMNRALGLGMAHAPYRGFQPALADLLGGQIAAVSVSLGDLVRQAQAGKLRILAVSGEARSKFAPEIATFAEQGVPGLDMRDWFGVYIPGRAAPQVLARVAPLVAAAIGSPEMQQALAAAGVEARNSTPQELDRMGRADLERWGPIIRASGFVPES